LNNAIHTHYKVYPHSRFILVSICSSKYKKKRLITSLDRRDRSAIRETHSFHIVCKRAFLVLLRLFPPSFSMSLFPFFGG
jgi:hypothetical protein